MNIEALNKTIEAIKAAPAEKILMSFWFNRKTAKAVFGEPTFENVRDFLARDGHNIMLHSCSTAACIAGWTLVAHSVEEIKKAMPEWEWRGRFSRTAQALLGLNEVQASELFSMRNYEDDDIYVGNNLYTFDKLPDNVRKQAAINVLEILRDTGKVNWEYAIFKARKQA